MQSLFWSPFLFSVPFFVLYFLEKRCTHIGKYVSHRHWTGYSNSRGEKKIFSLTVSRIKVYNSAQLGIFAFRRNVLAYWIVIVVGAVAIVVAVMCSKLNVLDACNGLDCILQQFLFYSPCSSIYLMAWLLLYGMSCLLYLRNFVIFIFILVLMLLIFILSVEVDTI